MTSFWNDNWYREKSGLMSVGEKGPELYNYTIFMASEVLTNTSDKQIW